MLTTSGHSRSVESAKLKQTMLLRKSSYGPCEKKWKMCQMLSLSQPVRVTSSSEISYWEAACDEISQRTSGLWNL